MAVLAAAMAALWLASVSSPTSGAPQRAALRQAAEPAATVPPPDKPLTGKTIAIDPGHNGGNHTRPDLINRMVPAGGFRKACDTTGAQTNDRRLTESAFNWRVANLLKRRLEELGATVVMTRADNRGIGPCINRRAAIGNSAKADAAISIHADGGPPRGRGFHVIYPGLVRGYTEPILDRSRKLALDSRAALEVAGLRRSNYAGTRGLHRRTDIGGINLSKVPKVLIELGNMRNAGDASKLKSADWRRSTAQALTDALNNFLSGA